MIGPIIRSVKCPHCEMLLTIIDGASGFHDCFTSYTEKDWMTIGWVEVKS
jgi:hypothetical protein